MTIQERVRYLSEQGVDMETITLVLRSEGVPDSEIADAYDVMALSSSTEVIRGQYYIRM